MGRPNSIGKFPWGRPNSIGKFPTHSMGTPNLIGKFPYYVPLFYVMHNHINFTQSY